jgi:hypothetical protein
MSVHVAAPNVRGRLPEGSHPKSHVDSFAHISQDPQEGGLCKDAQSFVKMDHWTMKWNILFIQHFACEDEDEDEVTIAP